VDDGKKTLLAHFLTSNGDSVVLVEWEKDDEHTEYVVAYA